MGSVVGVHPSMGILMMGVHESLLVGQSHASKTGNYTSFDHGTQAYW